MDPVTDGGPEASAPRSLTSAVHSFLRLLNFSEDPVLSPSSGSRSKKRFRQRKDESKESQERNFLRLIQNFRNTDKKKTNRCIRFPVTRSDCSAGIRQSLIFFSSYSANSDHRAHEFRNGAGLNEDPDLRRGKTMEENGGRDPRFRSSSGDRRGETPFKCSA